METPVIIYFERWDFPLPTSYWGTPIRLDQTCSLPHSRVDPGGLGKFSPLEWWKSHGKTRGSFNHGTTGVSNGSLT